MGEKLKVREQSWEGMKSGFELTSISFQILCI